MYISKFTQIPQIEDYKTLYINRLELDFFGNSNKVIAVMDGALNFVFFTDEKVKRNKCVIKGVKFNVKPRQNSDYLVLERE